MPVWKMFLLAAAYLFFVKTAHAESSAVVFNMTLSQLVDKLNNQIRLDVVDKQHTGDAIVKSCKPSNGRKECAFRDGGFQYTVSQFKKFNLMNGKFTQKLRLEILEQNGRVAKFSVVGDRSDPVNLMVFIGTVVDAIRIFDPSAGKKDPKELSDKLGLLRGDDDPTIGELKVDIENYAEIDCIGLRSTTSSAVGCLFRPRS